MNELQQALIPQALIQHALTVLPLIGIAPLDQNRGDQMLVR